MNTHTIESKHTSVVKASTRDMKAVSGILASAFTEDPLMNWLEPNANLYASLFYAELEAIYKHHDHVYINKALSGAASWLPPGVSRNAGLSWRALVAYANIFISSGSEGLKRLQRLEAAMEHHHIDEPHYYLHAVGARMGQQGKGIGSSLLKAGLVECDKHSMPAYLESSNEKNNPLYQRFGFEIIEEVKIDETAPPFWSMRREARS